MPKQMIKSYLFYIILIAFIAPAFAHQNHHQPSQSHLPKFQADRLAKINTLYTFSVKPIFQNKCFDCHSQKPNYPWYHAIPVIKQLIDRDISEAKEHLDFTNDFPFLGHGQPNEDLKAIQTTVNNNSMPPLRYKLLHQNAVISAKEKNIILEWIQASQNILGEKI